MEITWRVISGEGEMGEWGKGTGNKKHKCRYKIEGGRLRILWEMEKPNNLHGHELRWGNADGRGATGQSAIKGRKKWENCNSIIHKKYF